MQLKNTAKVKKNNYKTLQNNIQTNFVVRYLDYNHKKIQINTETFTMLSTREKERKKTNNGRDISVTFINYKLT